MFPVSSTYRLLQFFIPFFSPKEPFGILRQFCFIFAVREAKSYTWIMRCTYSRAREYFRPCGDLLRALKAPGQTGVLPFCLHLKGFHCGWVRTRILVLSSTTP